MKRHRKLIIAIIIVLLICFIEFIFDVFEIIVGGMVDLTNPIRPRYGTVWEIKEQDIEVDARLAKMGPSKSSDTIQLHVDNLSELKNTIAERGSVILASEQLLQIYNTLSPLTARAVAPPFDLLKILQSDKWIWTKVEKGKSSLNFYFLDGNHRLLFDSYPDLTLFYRVPLADVKGDQRLQSFEEFKDRTFTAEQFFDAFNRLPNSMKLQIINNPYQLIRWFDRIVAVGISKYTIDKTILIGFEVTNTSSSEVHTFQASELAVKYLVAKLRNNDEIIEP